MNTKINFSKCCKGRKASDERTTRCEDSLIYTEVKRLSKIYQQKSFILLTRHIFLDNVYSFLYISLFIALIKSEETYQYHLESTIQDRLK